MEEHVICHLKPFEGLDPLAYNAEDVQGARLDGAGLTQSGADMYNGMDIPHIMRIEADEDGEVAASSSSAVALETQVCHWCCHTFTNDVVMIPTRRLADSYAGTGTYCSYSCAAASIFDECADTNNAWTQYQHLNDLRCRATTKMGPIVRAPPRRALAMFGGNMDIETFRSDRDVIVLSRPPPMVVDTPKLEEMPASHVYRDLYVPIDDDRISKYKVRLQRQKPKKNFMNTLDFVLGGGGSRPHDPRAGSTIPV